MHACETVNQVQCSITMMKTVTVVNSPFQLSLARKSFKAVWMGGYQWFPVCSCGLKQITECNMFCRRVFSDLFPHD